MKMRLTPPVAGRGAWLIAGRSAAGAVLLAVTVSACTGGGSSAPSIFTPSAPTSGPSSSHPGTRTPSPTGEASRSPVAGHVRLVPTPQASATATLDAHGHPRRIDRATPTHTRHPGAHGARPADTPTRRRTRRLRSPTFPTAAPETGGGGTAGLQDSLLFGTGAAAVLVGFGTLAYRRRLARKLGGNDPASPDPADKEPADR